MALCRGCPICPSNALLSCHKGQGSAGPRVGSDLHLGTQSSGCSVQFSRSVISDSLRPHGLQHARLPCPSAHPGACSNSCPSSQWYHSTISSSVISFSSYLQSCPASGSFQRVSSSHQVAKVLEFQLQHQSFQWIFRNDFLWIDWFDLLAVQGMLRVFSSTTDQKYQFFGTQLYL